MIGIRIGGLKKEKDKKAAPERDTIKLCGAVWARQPTKIDRLMGGGAFSLVNQIERVRTN